MADILGRMEQVYAGGLTSDASWMFWDGLPNGGLGMLITQMSIQYQQPIRKIYEIGPWVTAPTLTGNSSGAPVYYVAGRPEGSLQLGRIAGPTAALGGFYKSYGNICSILNSLFFVSSTGCIGGLPGLNAGGLPGQNGGGVLPGEGSVIQGGLQFDGVATSRDTIIAGAADPFLGWYMNGVVINGLGLSTQAQEMMVMESVQCQFVSLKLYTGTPTATGAVGAWTEL